MEIQILTHLQPMTVQVQIRRTDGSDVSLDDCAGFSGPMGEALESQALLTEAYVLEISSPGIGEQLQSDRDFQTFRSYPVEVLYRDDEGRSNGNRAPCSNAMPTTSRSMCAGALNASPEPL